MKECSDKIFMAISRKRITNGKRISTWIFGINFARIFIQRTEFDEMLSILYEIDLTLSLSFSLKLPLKLYHLFTIDIIISRTER